MEGKVSKQEFRTIVMVMAGMMIMDVFEFWRSNRNEVFVSLGTSVLIILLFYLRYKDRLTEFSKTQKTISLSLVFGLALFFVVSLIAITK